MTRVLTAELSVRGKGCFFSLLNRLLSSSRLCCDMCSLAVAIPLDLTTPAETTQSGRVGGEAAVGNHLLAKGTDGPNTRGTHEPVTGIRETRRRRRHLSAWPGRRVKALIACKVLVSPHSDGETGKKGQVEMI